MMVIARNETAKHYTNPLSTRRSVTGRSGKRDYLEEIRNDSFSKKSTKIERSKVIVSLWEGAGKKGKNCSLYVVERKGKRQERLEKGVHG